MRTPNSTFRNRLIALSICLCALLAFSTTLSADTTNFILGTANLGTYTPTGGRADQVGPYPGTLTIVTSTGSTVSTNSLFFCLTGNQYAYSQEYGNVTTPLQAASPLKEQEEQAAFLASLLLTKAAEFSVTVSTKIPSWGNAYDKYVDFSGGDLTDFRTAIDPIQTAIWYIMGTLPSQDSALAGNLHSDTRVEALVKKAQNEFGGYNYDNVQVFNFVSSKCEPHGQSFISVNTLTTATPEPGTMVLFGAGALLMGLGCVRRRLAKRPR
jgi:hypothetical protein